MMLLMKRQMETGFLTLNQIEKVQSGDESCYWELGSEVNLLFCLLTFSFRFWLFSDMSVI